jgi:hypothetical protein
LSGRTLSYVPSSGGTFDGNVESSPLAYHFTGSALGSSAVRSYGGETGAAWLPFPYLYLGAALAFGMGSASPPAFTANGLTITPGAGVNVSDTGVGGVVGVRLPLGALSLRADALLGASFLSLDEYVSTGGRQLTASGSATAFLVEPRLHADVWLTPFVTVGLFATMPSFTPSATNAGFSLAFHTSAFDGRFRVF